MKLNEEQTLAVEHPLDEPACLIAGAGSGKTRVLTERVRWLIEKGVPARKICCITFTNKAAGELVERLGINETTPFEEIPRVSTIHSLALSMVRRNPRAFGFPSDKVSPLDDYDQTQLLKKIIEREKLEEKLVDTMSIKPQSLVYRILDMIQFHRARGIGFAKDYTEEIHERALEMHSGYHAIEPPVVEVWRMYEQEKLANSVLDFDDMLHFTTRRMREDPAWLASVQRLFQHVLMDEAQDTNPVQWEFVNGLLGPENRNIYVVGDMSQSIYGFNGAVPEILKRFSEGWRDQYPKLYRIARNHRSVPEIVKLANAIQKQMKRTIPLKMESWRGMNGESGDIQLLKGCLPLDIAGAIANQIHHDARLKTNPILYKENAILVRSGTQIRDIEAEMVRLRIPYIIRGGRGLLQTEEVRDVLSYLKIATNERDFMAFVRSTGAPRRGVGEKALEKLRAIANEHYSGNLILAAANFAPKLAVYCQQVETIKANAANPIEALNVAINLTRYKEYISEKYKKEREKVTSKLENLDSLVQLIGSLLEDREMTTEDIVFQLTMERPSEDDTDGAVVISTIHAAKGLEWKRVFITNLYESSLPHMYSMGSEEEIEEERRLFYVACTRPKDICVLCIPGMVRQGFKGGDGGPNTRPVTPSRFLYELGIK